MGEVRYMISEAAKQLKVESHVLRYWEDELNIDIDRTDMGHRFYTNDDIQLFRCIKKLKGEGMLLKDLRALIPELKATRVKFQENLKTDGKEKASYLPRAKAQQLPAQEQAELTPSAKLEYAKSLIGGVLKEVITSNNEVLKNDICKNVTSNVIREMGLMFRAKEVEEEEHFRKLDFLIRQQQENRKETARETTFGKLKHILG